MIWNEIGFMFLYKDVDTSSNNIVMFERIMEGKVWENVKHEEVIWERHKRTKREKKMKAERKSVKMNEDKIEKKSF